MYTSIFSTCEKDPALMLKVIPGCLPHICSHDIQMPGTTRHSNASEARVKQKAREKMASAYIMYVANDNRSRTREECRPGFPSFTLGEKWFSPAQLPFSPSPLKPALHVHVRPAALSKAGAATSAHVALPSHVLPEHASMSASKGATYKSYTTCEPKACSKMARVSS